MGNNDFDIIENFCPENYLGFAVNRAAIMLRRNLVNLFIEAKIDITAEEFALLGILWDKGVLYQTELNDLTLKDKTIITRLLAKLNKKGFIEKRPDEDDRRNLKISLTEKGILQKYEILPIVLGLLNQATNNIDENELEITIKTLKKLCINLNTESEIMRK